MNNGEEMFFLRKAVISDIDLIYKWRNDADVRRNSFHTEIIPYEDHLNWFKNAMQREDLIIFIFGKDNIPMGQIRVNYWYDELVISYSVDREYRGNHYGQKMIEMLEGELCKEDSLRQLGEYMIGYVKKDNTASQKTFETLKFQKEEQKQWIKYSKYL